MYSVQHKVDRQFYAIKKTVLHLQSTLSGSEALCEEELEKMTKEVRVLACIKDSHVINYNHSWFELSEEHKLPIELQENDEDSNCVTTDTANSPKEVSLSSKDSKQSGSVQEIVEGTATNFSAANKIVLYIQMELCEHTLEDYLNDANRLHFAASKSSALTTEEYKERLRVAYQIMQGLQAIHAKYNITHRDLTPRNIFFSKNGTIKIGDFGLATKSLYLTKTAPSPCCLVPLQAPILPDLPPKLDLADDDYSTIDDGDSSTRSSYGHERATMIIGTKTYAAPEQMKEGIVDQSVC